VIKDEVNYSEGKRKKDWKEELVREWRGIKRGGRGLKKALKILRWRGVRGVRREESESER